MGELQQYFQVLNGDLMLYAGCNMQANLHLENVPCFAPWNHQAAEAAKANALQKACRCHYTVRTLDETMHPALLVLAI